MIYKLKAGDNFIVAKYKKPGFAVDIFDNVYETDDTIEVIDFKVSIPEVGSKMPNLFEFSDDGDGTFRINNVPIFKAYVGNKNNKDKPNVIDVNYLEEMVANFHAIREASVDVFESNHFWLPKIHVSHTSEGDEKPVVGFIDNLRRFGDYLLCDYRFLSPEIAEALKKGYYPDRSIELDYKNKVLRSVALLGATSAPFHMLPQMRPTAVKYCVGRNVAEVVNFEERVIMPNSPIDKLAYLCYAYNAELPKEFNIAKYDHLGLEELFELIRKFLISSKTMRQNVTPPNKFQFTVADFDRFCDAACKKGKEYMADDDTKVVDDKDKDDVTKMSHDELLTAYKDMQSVVATLQEGVKALQQANVDAKTAHAAYVEEQERINYSDKLTALRAKGNSAVRSSEAIDKHLKIIMGMGKEARTAYYEALEALPNLETRTKVPVSQFSDSEGKNPAVVKFTDEINKDSALKNRLRKLGVDVETYAVCAAFNDKLETINAVDIEESDSN